MQVLVCLVGCMSLYIKSSAGCVVTIVQVGFIIFIYIKIIMAVLACAVVALAAGYRL